MTDIFRTQYRELKPNEKLRIQNIKEKAAALHEELKTIEKSEQERELAIARTKLEECVMWATKAVSK